ncbi:signal peptidase II [Arsukibacterium indicum]|uniref:Lipoprotein signal peptidase n=1 Tax=Arsukibacterium indicum TaxID=2848612 RepID=A0ABS6MKU8_9GAMM|nr:signal peptidase II [Arsukibacterium indicum]MBV2129443.1 signal peptidase II [Arsukibacterium indicum]
MQLFKETGWRWWWLILLFIVLDQASKQWVLHAIPYQGSIPLLPVFELAHVYNRGAAFSFLSNAGGWQRWFFTGIAVVISCVIAIWLSRVGRAQLKLSLALAFVLAGAIGNLIDRLVYGYVIDMLHVFYKSWSYPVFNLADSVIFIGAVLLIWDSFSSSAEVKT